MVAQDAVAEHIDAEDRGERFESTADPFSAKRVVVAGNRIEPGEKGAAYTPLDGMYDVDGGVMKLLITFGTPLINASKNGNRSTIV